ncbi:MAG: 23S rRNA (uracil(1939)-C(5))-methyltransferase RlmD [Ruminococcus sp.]|nr:23S rRNA (uracil(1939)-C(5))-methyltransferase RlmD [Ruminococcus sp.]
MQKNDCFETEILDLTIDGHGVCRVDGMAVFVPHTAVGDRIRVKIVKVLKHYAFGIADTLLAASADRIDPACTVKSCGGCVFQHLNYDAELRIKEKTVEDAFLRIGKLTPAFLPILGGNERTRYRNKAQYPFAVGKDGIATLGFFARHSHRVIPVTDCLLQPVIFREIAAAVLQFVRAEGIPIYEKKTGTGLMRHLYLCQGAHSGEIMVCLIVRTPIRKKLMSFAKQLQAQFPQIQSICMNVNPKQTNVILGDQTQTLWGRDTITDTMCGISVDISPESFYQVNTLQTERLYGVAKSFAQLSGKERLLDLYCGAGTIGLSMADQAHELIGVEIVPEAVENAKKNAQRAGIRNARFYCGDAGTIAAKLWQQGETPDVIVVDPPRKGCDAAAIDAMVQMHPDRIVMVSCNPATAARDCALLQQSGYRVERVQAVDLFPGTGCVETVACLTL